MVLPSSRCGGIFRLGPQEGRVSFEILQQLTCLPFFLTPRPAVYTTKSLGNVFTLPFDNDINVVH